MTGYKPQTSERENKMRKITALLMALVAFASTQAATLDFATVADTAVTTINDAAAGIGPSVIAIVAVLVAVGVAIKLIHKAGR